MEVAFLEWSFVSHCVRYTQYLRDGACEGVKKVIKSVWNAWIENYIAYRRECAKEALFFTHYIGTTKGRKLSVVNF
jgi:hypothetical protein